MTATTTGVTGLLTAAAPLAVAGPIVVACVLLVAGSRLPRPLVDGLATAAALALAGVGGVLLDTARTGTAVVWLGGWTPGTGGHAGVGIPLVVDAASALLVTTIGVLAAAALLFGWRYFDTVEAHFHALVLLFAAGMAGFVLAGDLFDMLVFFELMGAVGYALAAYKIEEARSLQGGLTFGVVNSLGAYLTLCGIGLLYARTGALGLAPLGAALSGPPDGLVVTGFVLVVTGWLVKAAMVPFHFWLADAHAVAPTPVCVLFSGVMAPLGIYGVARVHAVVFATTLPADDVAHTLVVLGVVTALLGSVMCVVQRNLKRLLAYSTIAHIGLFALGAAPGPPEGAAAWITYLVGHAGVKGALFLLVGVLLARHGSVDEIELHGAARRGPRSDRWAAGVLVVAGLALAGLPPWGLGLGKAALEESGGHLGEAVVLLTSTLTGAAVLRIALRVLGVGPAPTDRADGALTSGEGEERETRGRLDRVPPTMLLAPVLLLAASLAVGVVPVLGRVLGDAGAHLADGAGYRAAVLAGAATPPLPPEPVGWHPAGVVLGLVTTAAAALLALATVGVGRLPARVRRRLPGPGPVVVRLERLHSGHVGDYVAFLLLGVAALGALVGLPLLAG